MSRSAGTAPGSRAIGTRTPSRSNRFSPTGEPSTGPPVTRSASRTIVPRVASNRAETSSRWIVVASSRRSASIRAASAALAGRPDAALASCAARNRSSSPRRPIATSSRATRFRPPASSASWRQRRSRCSVGGWSVMSLSPRSKPPAASREPTTATGGPEAANRSASAVSVSRSPVIAVAVTSPLIRSTVARSARSPTPVSSILPVSTTSPPGPRWRRRIVSWSDGVRLRGSRCDRRISSSSRRSSSSAVGSSCLTRASWVTSRSRRTPCGARASRAVSARSCSWR